MISVEISSIIKRKAAIQVPPPTDAVGLTTGKGPGIFKLSAGSGAFHIGKLLPPTFPIFWFRDHVPVAHPIQHGNQRWAARQKFRGKACQIGQGRIETLQMAAVIKNRESGRQLGKRLGHCLNHVAQVGFGPDKVIDGLRIADIAPDRYVEPSRAILGFQAGPPLHQGQTLAVASIR